MEEKLIESNNDMSVMIKLTPVEIKNILRDFATRYANAKAANTVYSVHDLCDTYYKLTFDLLAETDPDRFINKN